MSRVLPVLAGLCLLAAAAMAGLAALGLAPAVGAEPLLTLAFVLTALAGSTTLVAAYRQLPRPRPRLVLGALALQVAGAASTFAAALGLASDADVQFLAGEMQRGVSDAVEAGSMSGAEAQLLSDLYHVTVPGPGDLALALLSVAALFALPLLRSLRR